MVERISVSFVCQRCLQPLILDQSLNNINCHTLAELSLPICSSQDIDLESQASSLDNFVPAFKLVDSTNGSNGFCLLGKDDSSNSKGHQMKVYANLFDFLSSNSGIDHPLCEECTDTLLDMMDKELKNTKQDFQEYSDFLKTLDSESNSEEDLEFLTKEFNDLKCEEERLLGELAMLKNEEQGIEKEIKSAEEEKDRIKQDEEKYWSEYCKYQHELSQTDEQQKSLELQLQYSISQLNKFKNTNVFNATFHIWHSGHFGTINNFRLGTLPSAPVDWSEINAAWGQTALLLTALARKLNLTFQRYRIVPYGNHSYIEDTAEHKNLPLFASGGAKFFWDTKFDMAMVAFLDCLQQFKEELGKGDTEFHLPYNMDSKGKIEDETTGNTYSVKYQFNSQEQWTKALKFMLTNLKWGLAWVSSQFKNQFQEL